MKKCSPSLTIKMVKNQNHTKIPKTPPTTGVGQDVGTKELSYTAVGNAS
jgi:hypothetical protein